MRPLINTADDALPILTLLIPVVPILTVEP
jgi:hypothetical protein